MLAGRKDSRCSRWENSEMPGCRRLPKKKAPLYRKEETVTPKNQIQPVAESQMEDPEKRIRGGDISTSTKQRETVSPSLRRKSLHIRGRGATQLRPKRTAHDHQGAPRKALNDSEGKRGRTSNPLQSKRGKLRANVDKRRKPNRVSVGGEKEGGKEISTTRNRGRSGGLTPSSHRKKKKKGNKA